jgi:hypothetical protein
MFEVLPFQSTPAEAEEQPMPKIMQWMRNVQEVSVQIQLRLL